MNRYKAENANKMRWVCKKLRRQGAQKMRNEAYLQIRRSDEF